MMLDVTNTSLDAAEKGDVSPITHSWRFTTCGRPGCAVTRYSRGRRLYPHDTVTLC